MKCIQVKVYLKSGGSYYEIPIRVSDEEAAYQVKYNEAIYASKELWKATGRRYK